MRCHLLWHVLLELIQCFPQYTIVTNLAVPMLLLEGPHFHFVNENIIDVDSGVATGVS